MPFWLLGIGKFLKSVPLAVWMAAASIALVIWLSVSLNSANNRVDALKADVAIEKARADGAERRESALKQAEIQREMDTKARTQETERTNDALDKIGQQITDKKPVASNAAALAVVCARLRRQGDTASAAYRSKCG